MVSKIEEVEKRNMIDWLWKSFTAKKSIVFVTLAIGFFVLIWTVEHPMLMWMTFKKNLLSYWNAINMEIKIYSISLYFSPPIYWSQRTNKLIFFSFLSNKYYIHMQTSEFSFQSTFQINFCSFISNETLENYLPIKNKIMCS